MALASALVPGVDVWLNNPIRPQEASGTSGMRRLTTACPTSVSWMAGGSKVISKG